MQERELVVYGKDACPQCDTLKMRLTNENIPFTYLTLNKDFSTKELMEIKPLDVRTFPVSFVKYEHWHWKDIVMDYIKNEDISLLALTPQER